MDIIYDKNEERKKIKEDKDVNLRDKFPLIYEHINQMKEFLKKDYIYNDIQN